MVSRGFSLQIGEGLVRYKTKTPTDDKAKKGMGSISDDLIIEILLWLPVISLVRFRCVCKTWRTLFSDPDFIQSHYNRSIQTNNFALFCKCASEDLLVHSPIEFESPHFHKLNIPFHNSVSSYLLSLAKIASSCNGVVCLSTPINIIFLLNPSTRSYTQLPNHQFGQNIPLSVGLGYNSSSSEFKVFLINSVTWFPSKSEVKIYTTSTNSWRRITDIPHYIVSESGTLLNGTLHWMARPGNVVPATSKLIVSFDVGIEKFREIGLPRFGDGADKLRVSLSVYKGSLCIFHVGDDGNVNIWVMKEYGIEKSWTKQFSIRQPPMLSTDSYFGPFRFLPNGKILLRMMRDESLIMYDPRSKSGMNLTARGMIGRFVVIHYVESLVSIGTTQNCRFIRKFHRIALCTFGCLLRLVLIVHICDLSKFI